MLLGRWGKTNSINVKFKIEKMRILPIILLLICFNGYAQVHYQIPVEMDTASLIANQFDFKNIEKEISKSDKIMLLKELISFDTSSCYYFTGYDYYSEFIENLDRSVDALPAELYRRIHLVKLNHDDEYDFIYDRLNFGWDSQNIYSVIKQDDGWILRPIPGFIIVDVYEDDGVITGYETYKWACCEFPFDFYYFLEQQHDSVVIKSVTAFSRHSKFSENLIVDTTKIIEMKTDSLTVYALNDGNLREVYRVNQKVTGEFISEASINGQEFVLVRLQVDDQRWKYQHFNYFLGWVKREKINYVW